MTDGSSQGLFVIVAVVIFGIFVAISYVIFSDSLSPSLASIFRDSTHQATMNLHGSLNEDIWSNVLVHPTFNNLHWDNETYPLSVNNVKNTYIRGEQFNSKRDPNNKIYIKQTKEKYLEMYKQEESEDAVAITLNQLKLENNKVYTVYMEVEALAYSSVRLEVANHEGNDGEYSTKYLGGKNDFTLNRGDKVTVEYTFNSKNYDPNKYIVFGGISKWGKGHVLIKNIHIKEGGIIK